MIGLLVVDLGVSTHYMGTGESYTKECFPTV